MFLERYPDWRGKVVLFQISSPPDTLTEEGDTRRMEQLHQDINEYIDHHRCLYQRGAHSHASSLQVGG